VRGEFTSWERWTRRLFKRALLQKPAPETQKRGQGQGTPPRRGPSVHYVHLTCTIRINFASVRVGLTPVDVTTLATRLPNPPILPVETIGFVIHFFALYVGVA